MKTVRQAGTITIGILTLALGAAANPAQAEEWEWMLVPYLWGEDTSLDVSINDEPVIGGDLSFSDLLDKLDFAFQLHFEGRRGKAGFFADFTTLSLSDSKLTEGRPLLPDGTQIDTEIDVILFEAAGFYRPSGASHGLDVLLGVRVTDLDFELGITIPPPIDDSTRAGVSETFTDGFAGLRYSMPLGENWMLALRGDVGAGDSELVWNASAYFGYLFGQRDQFGILFGYRHMDVEYESFNNGSKITVDQTMSGPAAGFGFRF